MTSLRESRYLIQVTEEEFLDDEGPLFSAGSTNDHPEFYVLSRHETTSGNIEAMLESADAAAHAADETYRALAGDPPPKTTVAFGPHSLETTYGQWRVARQREDAALAAYYGERFESMRQAAHGCLDAVGLQTIELPYLGHLLKKTENTVRTVEFREDIYQDHQFVQRPRGTSPLTPVYAYTIDLTAAVLDPQPAVYEVISFDPTPVCDEATAREIVRIVHDQVRASRVRHAHDASRQSWAASLTPAQVDDLDAREYSQYQKYAPTPSRPYAGPTHLREVQARREVAIVDDTLLRYNLVRVVPTTAWGPLIRRTDLVTPPVMKTTQKGVA
jgi:hypothetical protein